MSTADEREIRRKLKVLRHAEQSGNTAKTCWYFGISRSTFYRWQRRYKKFGEAGLKNEKPIPINPANKTPDEIEEKVLYLRKKYHLGPIRIVWYLARDVRDWCFTRPYSSWQKAFWWCKFSMITEVCDS